MLTSSEENQQKNRGTSTPFRLNENYKNHESQHKLIEVPVSNVAHKARHSFFLDPMTQERIKQFTNFNDLIGISGSSSLVLNRMS